MTRVKYNFEVPKGRYSFKVSIWRKTILALLFSIFILLSTKYDDILLYYIIVVIAITFVFYQTIKFFRFQLVAVGTINNIKYVLYKDMIIGKKKYEFGEIQKLEVCFNENVLLNNKLNPSSITITFASGNTKKYYVHIDNLISILITINGIYPIIQFPNAVNSIQKTSRSTVIQRERSKQFEEILKMSE